MKKSLVQMHLAVFLAGFTAILGKLINLNEGLLVWYRVLFTLLIIGGVLIFRGKLPRLHRKEIFNLALTGLVIAMHWVTFYGSIKFGTISIALVCLSCAGFFTALLEPFLLRKRLVLPEVLLGIVAIAGVYIIFDFHPQYTVSILLGLVSAFGSAVFAILNKRLVEKYPPRTLVLYEMLGGLVLLTLVLPFYFSFSNPVYFIPTIPDLFWLIVLAAVCTVYCFDLQLAALKHISAFTMALTYNLEPLYGITLAFLFFKEGDKFNGWFYFGLALIAVAIALQMAREWYKRRLITNNRKLSF